MSSFDYLVVGAGFTGATFAREKAKAGFKVKVIDSRDHMGGNAYDYRHETGILIHKYGPHLFHTNSDRVFEWLSQFTGWVPYEHRVMAAWANGQSLIPVPFNFRSIDLCFPSWQANIFKSCLAETRTRDNQRFTLGQLMKSVDHHIVGLGMFVYENIFKHYTQKMWGMTLDQLGPAVADRVPIIAGYDDRYFADKYQALPVSGYTMLFKRMLSHENIEFCPSTSYEHGMQGDAKLFFTGPIDEYFGYTEGKLPYRGITFTMAEGSALRNMTGAATLNYTLADYEHTRATSMRVINGLQTNSNDVVVCETPNSTDKFYPYTHEEARNKYKMYEWAGSAFPDRVRFAGRLGSYQYLNMDQAVAQALKCAEEF